MGAAAPQGAPEINSELGRTSGFPPTAPSCYEYSQFHVASAGPRSQAGACGRVWPGHPRGFHSRAPEQAPAHAGPQGHPDCHEITLCILPEWVENPSVWAPSSNPPASTLLSQQGENPGVPPPNCPCYNSPVPTPLPELGDSSRGLPGCQPVGVGGHLPSRYPLTCPPWSWMPTMCASQALQILQNGPWRQGAMHLLTRCMCKALSSE